MVAAGRTDACYVWLDTGTGAWNGTDERAYWSVGAGRERVSERASEERGSDRPSRRRKKKKKRQSSDDYLRASVAAEHLEPFRLGWSTHSCAVMPQIVVALQWPSRKRKRIANKVRLRGATALS